MADEVQEYNNLGVVIDVKDDMLTVARKICWLLGHRGQNGNEVLLVYDTLRAYERLREAEKEKPNA